MKKWIGAYKRLATIPVPATLFVLALGLFLWGAYAVSPWFDPGAAYSAYAHHRAYEVVLGLVYMAIGSLRILGVIRRQPKWMLKVPYGLMMAYLFLALLEIQVVGWLPLTWVPLVICAITAGICRLAILYGGGKAE